MDMGFFSLSGINEDAIVGGLQNPWDTWNFRPRVSVLGTINRENLCVLQ
jgi:hypothetical protein